jgi:hypothetical protein
MTSYVHDYRNLSIIDVQVEGMLLRLNAGNIGQGAMQMKGNEYCKWEKK